MLSAETLVCYIETSEGDVKYIVLKLVQNRLLPLPDSYFPLCSFMGSGDIFKLAFS